MIRTAPFYGKGIGFPFRVNPATGGVVVTEGRADNAEIAVEYVTESFTSREKLPARDNHISEAIFNIIITRPGEHDTLPEYGSRTETVINDPNNRMTEEEFETWLEVATQRWERRARIPVPEGVDWHPTGEGIDQGILPCVLNPEIIRTQVPGNLVSPFVTPRQARAAEYPLGEIDAEGHDWCSRYHGRPAYQVGNERYIRPRRTKRIPPRPDDMFEEVRHFDTWLLISWRMYGDIKFWWVISDCYSQDAAERGEPSSADDAALDPRPGTLLRMPSRTRVLMELAA